MKKLLILLGIVLLAGQAIATCEISTGHGLLSDTDCDAVPDRQDNCPQTPNPSQADTDKNGIGDACDTRQRVAQDNQQKHRSDQHTDPQETQQPDIHVDALQYREFQAGGPGATYPVTITNNGQATDVTVYLTNVTGTYSVKPSPQQTVKTETTYYVHLTTDTAGQYTPTLVVETDGQRHTQPLTAHAFEPTQDRPWSWILITAALIIILILAAIYTWYDREPPVQEEEDIYSYY